MKPITKKRAKAYFIDAAISAAVTMGVEQVLRKKVKNEFVHTVINPTLIMWSLEYFQLRKSGQTYGMKKAGLVLKDQQGNDLTCKQLVKRMAYRDILSTFKYIGNREAFEGKDGTVFPHDAYANTVIKEI
ncbi:MAG TPA: RDD family protein [Bacillota bacterium]|nr:RDD family protein [Bacillota bacterium]